MSAMAYDQTSEVSELDIEVKNDDLKLNSDLIWANTSSLESFGEKKVLITGISIGSNVNSSGSTFKGGENISLKIKMFSTDNIDNLISGFIVNDNLGNAVFGANTHVYSDLKLSFKKNQEYIVEYNFALPFLRNGVFSISPAIAEGTPAEHIQHHWIHDAITFIVNSIDKKAQMGWLFSIDNINIKVD